MGISPPNIKNTKKSLLGQGIFTQAAVNRLSDFLRQEAIDNYLIYQY
jgi:hypothetical protein